MVCIPHCRVNRGFCHEWAALGEMQGRLWMNREVFLEDALLYLSISQEGNGGGIIFQQCLDNGAPLWMCKPIMRIIFTFSSHHPAKEDPVEHFFFLREVLVKDSHPFL